MQYNDYKYKYLKYKQKYFQLKKFIKQSNQKGGLYKFFYGPTKTETKTETQAQYEDRQRKTIIENRNIKTKTIANTITILDINNENRYMRLKNIKLISRIIPNIIKSIIIKILLVLDIIIELNSNETLVHINAHKSVLFNSLNNVLNNHLTSKSCVITKVEPLSKREKQEEQNKIYNDILTYIKVYINRYFVSIEGIMYRTNEIQKLYDEFNNLNQEIFESEYKFTKLEIYFIINCYPKFFLTIIDAILLACKERDKKDRQDKAAFNKKHEVKYRYGYI